MNDRTCIVTGQKSQADKLIRFVIGPDGQVVPDIAGKLPGRGCWVTATREHVEKAVQKNGFARGLKTKVSVESDIASVVETLLESDALRSFAMARKAGQIVSGFSQVDQQVRSGAAVGVLHALEAAGDGVRKIDQARRATVHLGGSDIPAFQLFTVTQMDLAFGDGNVIHAALLDGGAGNGALRRTIRLHRFRHGAEQPGKAWEGKTEDA